MTYDDKKKKAKNKKSDIVFIFYIVYKPIKNI